MISGEKKGSRNFNTGIMIEPVLFNEKVSVDMKNMKTIHNRGGE